MKQVIKGLAYVVGNDVDTDQIIPAEHLVYSLSVPEERRLYGRYAMCGVPPEGQGLPFGNRPFTEPEAYESKYRIMIGGKNFGCGSSREHAPFALKEAGLEAVVAESFARIFYRNAVDGGFVAPFECMERLVDRIRTDDEVELDTTNSTLTNFTTGEVFLLRPLGDVADILRAGNIFKYARQSGMIAS